jgi:hypothetical protein
VQQQQTRSTSSGTDVSSAQGSAQPRLWTPPRRDLTDPAATYGHDVVAFARDVLRAPLDPWQEWLVIHGGELAEDGRPRFRQVLALVARQNGKTHLLKVLALYWLFVERRRMVVGMSTNLDYAREAWLGAVDIAQHCEWLAPEVGNVRLANGEQCLTTTAGNRYRIAASNRRGGRSLTIDRLVIDELREHQNWNAYNAALPAMSAVRDAQAWLISNQGDDSSVVLDGLRGAALEHAQHGNGDDQLAIFEWSAPDDSDPEDVGALCQANPSIGIRMDPIPLLGAARRAKAAGGQELTGFKTESMCMRVHMLDPAIEPGAWMDAGTDAPLDLAEHREKVALVLDISRDGSHASVVAAAQIDGHCHVEVVGSWSGMGCAQVVRDQLPELVGKIRPRVLGWFPNGPAAALTADLAARRGADRWPPRGVRLQEIRGEITAVCMGAAEQVRNGHVSHPQDPMLDTHVLAAGRLWRGTEGTWVFDRSGAGPIDGTYAMAGALHLARTMRVKGDLVVV